MFCSRACLVKSSIARFFAAVRSVAAVRVQPGWSIGVIAAAAAMLLLGVGSQVAELIEASVTVSRPAPVLVRQTHGIVGRITLEEAGFGLTVTGPPGSSVLVVIDGRTPFTLSLDESGSGTAHGLKLDANPTSIRLVPIDVPPLELAIPATPTSTPSATATTTSTPPATVTLPPTSTSTPTIEPTTTATAVSVPAEPTTTPRPLGSRDRRIARSAPPVLHLVEDAGPRIAITFDGGHSADGTAAVLDTLQRLDLKVTMFLTGDFIEENPGLVRRALLAGHEVGNHTYSHSHLTSYADDGRHQLLDHVTRDWLRDELLKTEAAFRRTTGRSMAPLWRSPFGEENAVIRGWAMELGYLHVRWSSLSGASLDSLDWVDNEHSSLYQDAAGMVDRLLAFPKLKGGIVLMHLSSQRPDPPWNELPRFVSEIRRRGLEPVTVSELLEESKTWRPWLEKARKRHTKQPPEGR